MVAVAVTVLAGVLSLLSVVVALIKFQYHLLCQPLFLSFSYVSCCFTSIYPLLFFKDHIGNKVAQLFCVIHAIALYGRLSTTIFNFDEFIFVYVINIRFICNGEICLLICEKGTAKC